MSYASQFFPLLGAPARTTRYTSGSGTHTFLPGVKWCRVTVVGGGGKGGDTGSWNNGTRTYYEAGGGGGGGETRVFEFDPAQLLPGASYAVGAGMSNSRFHSLVARKGADGRDGAYEISSSHYEGGAGGGTQDIYAADDTNSAYIVPFGVWGAVGAVGGAKGSSGGAGGDSAFGQGGGGGAYVTGTAAPLAACNNGSVGGGPGAGGGGAGGGENHPNSAGTRTLGVGAEGRAGLIVVEEFVW